MSEARRLMVALLVASAVLVGARARAVAQAAPEDEDRPFELRATTLPGPVVVGRKASVSLTVVPGPGLRILEDGPFFIRLAAPGLKLARRKLRRANTVDPRAEFPRFEIAFVPEKAGRWVLTGTAVFYLCDERTCRSVRETVRWTVEATAAPAP